jgi:hypothetical protein
MKKTILAVILLTLGSSVAHSEDVNSDLMAAPNDYVLSLLALCKDYAVEDDITALELKEYLLGCINGELAESDYQGIKVVPKED